jgi:hypothetical protein
MIARLNDGSRRRASSMARQNMRGGASSRHQDRQYHGQLTFYWGGAPAGGPNDVVRISKYSETFGKHSEKLGHLCKPIEELVCIFGPTFWCELFLYFVNCPSKMKISNKKSYFS